MMTEPTVQFGRLPYEVVARGALAKLRPGAAKVYVVLCAHANEHWRAGVGMRRIAELAGVLTSSVSRSVAELRAAGLIHIEQAAKGYPFHYTIATSIPVNRSLPGERPTVYPPANGLNPDRSPAGAPTVRSRAKKRSLPSERNREYRVEQRGKGISPIGDGMDGDALLNRLAALGYGKPLERVKLVAEHPEAVAAAFAELDGQIAAGCKITNPGGWLRRRLEKPSSVKPHPPTEAVVDQLCRLQTKKANA